MLSCVQMIRLLGTILHHYEGGQGEKVAPVPAQPDMEEEEEAGHMSADSGTMLHNILQFTLCPLYMGEYCIL